MVSWCIEWAWNLCYFKMTYQPKYVTFLTYSYSYSLGCCITKNVKHYICYLQYFTICLLFKTCSFIKKHICYFNSLGVYFRSISYYFGCSSHKHMFISKLLIQNNNQEYDYWKNMITKGFGFILKKHNMNCFFKFTNFTLS